MDFLNYNSVEELPGLYARAIFKVNSSYVFKEEVDIVPTIIDNKLSYIPVLRPSSSSRGLPRKPSKGQALLTQLR